MKALLGRFLMLACLVLSNVLGAAQDMAVEDGPDRIDLLRRLTLEELIDMPVTTVSKKEQPFFDVPAAISVITGEEIRRSGARTVPDALRLAPGMEVSRVTGNQWAISARGFNDRFSGNLLVMIDGRSVYQPAFSGVYWDLQDVLLEDIDRIEVVRGPGGTLWGANAVNGVVNIITKHAKDTTGGYVTGGGGTKEFFGGGRYGAQVGERTWVRGYVKYDNFDNLELKQGNAYDSWDRVSTGARMDWQTEDDHVTLQGDFFYADEQQEIAYPSYAPPYSQLTEEDFIAKAGNILGRWTHTFDDEHDLQLQAYWDTSRRRPVSFDYQLDTYDVDFQHRIPLPWMQDTVPQELTYGLGYRYQEDRSRNLTNLYQFDPATDHFDTFSTFAQVEFQLVEDKLALTLGSKFEHNDFTGDEYQPNARLAWLMTPKHTLWGAVSRNVRTPNRAQVAFESNIPVSGVGLLRFSGNPKVDSEELLAFELGYRSRPVKRFYFDVATYYFMFDDVSNGETGTPFVETTPPPPHLVIPASPGNEGQADTYGVEIASEYELLDWWRLRAGYNWFDFRNQKNVTFDNAATPKNQAFLRSSTDFDLDIGKIEVDLWLRFRDELDAYDIGAFTDMDARIAWHPTPELEVAVVGQNLFSPQLKEFGERLEDPVSELPRSVYGQVSYRF